MIAADGHSVSPMTGCENCGKGDRARPGRHARRSRLYDTAFLMLLCISDRASAFYLSPHMTCLEITRGCWRQEIRAKSVGSCLTSTWKRAHPKEEYRRSYVYHMVAGDVPSIVPSLTSEPGSIVPGRLGEGSLPILKECEGTLPGTTGASASGKSENAQTIRVAFFFSLWYSFNVGYNLCTKFTLNVLDAPLTLAAVQLLVGIPYVGFLWGTGLRKAPRLSPEQVQNVLPVAMAHTMAHIGAVVSIGAGAVGFVQIVKSAEPLFTAALSFFTGNPMAWPVYITLLPVIGGVGMASVGEISFRWLAFGAAMLSNASASSRSVLGKKLMARSAEEVGEGLDAGNLYAIMTMMGTLVVVPLAIAVEGSKLTTLWDTAVQAGRSQSSLVSLGLLSGLFFYLYNEVSFYTLKAIHPVTHALGNTLKRVVMIAVSVIVFNHTFTPLGLFGCCTAIGGIMSYSLAKAKYTTMVKREGEGGVGKHQS